MKDQYHVKHGETTMGFVGWIGTFEGSKGTHLENEFESDIITDLKVLGAIPIAKVSRSAKIGSFIRLTCKTTTTQTLKVRKNVVSPTELTLML